MKTIIGPEIDCIAEIVVHITIIIEEEEISTMIENYRSTYRTRKRSGNGFGRNDRYDNRPNYRRDNVRQDQRYGNRSISQDCDRSRQRFRNTSRDSSRNRHQYSDRSQRRGRDRSKGPELLQEKRESRPRTDSRSRSSCHASTNRDRCRCYRCNEYDHFMRECPNTLTDEGSDQEDLDGATLQMLT